MRKWLAKYAEEIVSLAAIGMIGAGAWIIEPAAGLIVIGSLVLADTWGGRLMKLKRK